MHALLEPLRNVIDRAWLYLFHASWQSAVAGTVLLALVLVGKRWPAPLRYALLTVVLLKFVAPPFLAAPSGVFSRWGPAVASSQMTPLSVATDAMAGTTVAPRTTGNSTRMPSPPVGRSVAESQSPGELVRLPELHVRKDLRDVGPKSSATAENVTLIPSRDIDISRCRETVGGLLRPDEWSIRCLAGVVDRGRLGDRLVAEPAMSTEPNFTRSAANH